MITLKNYKFNRYENFSLKIEDFKIVTGERVFIVGPSGSGKTTLLRALCALEDKLNGELTIDNKLIKNSHDKILKELSIMFMTQDLGLWPHMNTSEHISFAMSKGKSIKQDVHYWLDLVSLSHRSLNRPHELSQGEQQRLALARVLCTQPKYLFLDEPFANVDLVLAQELLEMVDKEQQKRNFTLVKITHQYFGIKDEKTSIIVMDEGKILQKGKWMEIRDNPQNEWVEKWLRLIL